MNYAASAIGFSTTGDADSLERLLYDFLNFRIESRGSCGDEKLHPTYKSLL
jgi:hypothetical protein